MQKNIFSIIAELTGQNNMIIAPKLFIKLTGDLHKAVFLNQLIYWQDKMKGEWLFKTYEDWKEEIELSEYYVRKASNFCIEEGFLETKIKKAKGSPTVHYKLDKEKFMDWFFLKLKNLRNETEKFKELNKDYNIDNTSFNKLKEGTFSKENDNLKENISIEKNNQPKEKLNKFTIEVINSWNSHPATPIKHKIEPNKHNLELQRYLIHAQKGSFPKIVSLGQDFLKRNGITKKDCSKKFTQTELLNIIRKRMTKFFVKGYFPQDKTRLPRNLRDLFYNPGFYKNGKNRSGGQSSWFLMAAYNIPRKTKEPQPMKNIERKIRAKSKKCTVTTLEEAKKRFPHETDDFLMDFYKLNIEKEE